MAGDSELDQLNLDALADVVLNHFKVEPTVVGPFGKANLSWSVTAPDRVSVHLDYQKVGRTGSRTLTPTFTETHRLTARAGRYSTLLGTVTVQVNTRQCMTVSDGQVPKVLEAKIKDEINADDSGISFRLVPVPGPFGTVWALSKPEVSITQDRINIALKLRQEVDNFPNADVNLSVSFGLTVTPDPLLLIGYRQISATNVETHASVSFPWFAYLIPGALPGLYIAISNAEEKAHKRLRSIVARIVGPSGSPGSPERSLNNYFTVPHGMEKHDVRLDVSAEGDQNFTVTYCSHDEPGVFNGPVDSPLIA